MEQRESVMMNTMNSEKTEKTKFSLIIYYIITYFVLINVLVSSVLYYLHVSNQKEGVLEEIINKSRAAGHTVVSVITKGLKAGIPLTEIKGGSAYLDQKTQLTQELEYIVITDINGNFIAKSADAHNNLRGSLKRFVLSSNAEKETPNPFSIFSYYNVPLKINHDNNTIGYVHVGLSEKTLEHNLKDVFYNIAVILICAIIIGYELLRFIFKNSVQLPLGDLLRGFKNLVNRNFRSRETPREGEYISEAHKRLNNIIDKIDDSISVLVQKIKGISKNNIFKELIDDDCKRLLGKYTFSFGKKEIIDVQQSVESIRLIAFLMVLAEAILMTMLPSYATQFYEASWSVSKQIVGSLPIVVFTLFATISILVAPKISSRYGFRKTLVFGFSIYALGHFIAFLSGSLFGLLITRVITAFGYGITFVTCQNYVAAYAHAKDRVQSYAIFVVASGSGFLCGTPIGGILVDNIGYNFTFLFAFFASLLALHFTRTNIFDSKQEISKTATVKTPWSALLAERQLAAAIFLSGFPTRLLFTALIGYFYPLYLIHLGNTQSAIGRIMMLFGLLMFLISPIAARVVSRFKLPNYAALACSTVIALTLLIGWIAKSTNGVIFGVCVYTIASVIHISAMMSIIEKTSEDSKLSKTTVLGFYFVIERIAMIFGPALFGFFLAKTNFSTTLLVIGLLVLICNGLYALFIFRGTDAKNKAILSNSKESKTL